MTLIKYLFILGVCFACTSQLNTTVVQKEKKSSYTILHDSAKSESLISGEIISLYRDKPIRVSIDFSYDNIIATGSVACDSIGVFLIDSIPSNSNYLSFYFVGHADLSIPLDSILNKHIAVDMKWLDLRL